MRTKVWKLKVVSKYIKPVRRWIADKPFIFWPIVASLVLSIFLGLWITGYISYFINVTPPLKLGVKTNNLYCNYGGEEISTSIVTYTNYKNYYRYNRKKVGQVEKGNYSTFVYQNISDPTVTELAGKVFKISRDHNFSNDQALELATCFIQNIPYDQARGSKVLNPHGVGNISREEQFPYETLYMNSGICTDKTYLGALLLKEMGYGTAIFIFPDKSHMSLAIRTPEGYTDFNSKYSMMELTSTGWAPGVIPEGFNDNGQPSKTIKTINDINVADNPENIDIKKPTYIDAPTLVIELNNGGEYQRIVPIKNLANKIYDELDALLAQKQTLSLSYQELQHREKAQANAYSYYLGVSSTKLDCGFKYNYSYNYFSYSYYNSPYTYRCDTISNPEKSYAYSSYSYAFASYKIQVNYYNSLLVKFNSKLATFRSDVTQFEGYVYN
jgi:hypothetical protein